MLHAVLRPLRRLYEDWPFELCARMDASEIFRYDATYDVITSYGSENTAEAIIPLDGVLEIDHASEESEQHHRVDLFSRFLLRGFDPMPKLTLDWTLPTSRAEEKFALDWMDASNLSPHRHTIALQTHGSGNMKTLDPEVVEEVAKNLARDHSVVLMGQENRFKALTRFDHIYHPTGKILEILEILKLCDVAVTMDSGLLWLAHCASIPTICILGPTRERERLTLHPLYGEGKVGSVNLSQAIGCRPCFERAVKCKWKFHCMRSHADVVAPLVRDEIDRVLA